MAGPRWFRRRHTDAIAIHFWHLACLASHLAFPARLPSLRSPLFRTIPRTLGRGV